MQPTTDDRLTGTNDAPRPEPGADLRETALFMALEIMVASTNMRPGAAGLVKEADVIYQYLLQSKTPNDVANVQSDAITSSFINRS